MTIPVHLPRLAAVHDAYDLLLCDIWGVIHNGRAAFGAACDALAAFRASGKPVILISNAPRPSVVIPPQLARLGVRRDAWDAIVTSGDATRAEIAARGPNGYRIGPDKDAGLYDGLDVAFADAAHADYVICTGLREEMTEEPEDYAAEFAALIARGLPMVCANPDKIVQFGDQTIYCAGALAEFYAKSGGSVVMAGKPHAPIYDLCRAEAARLLGAAPPAARILAIGDGVSTDVAGAQAQGIDCLFVGSGIHAEDLRGPEGFDPARAQAFLASHGVSARYAAEALA
jgi:HAD superfamily hydrolase (TIGR01459 family)